ncbi:signal peptidase I [Cellulomonas soli]|uniref:signal peptidase I n=1 Tax=Cellulomonas soli TaxID=931535 RepID=UPI003F84715B
MSSEPQHPATDASRARRLLGAVPTVLLYVAAAVAAWFLWPTSLGGCTTITLVNGHSMEPTYYTGDIVVSRCGNPQVGDVVVYEPPGYGSARVIHRIVGGTPEGWVIQGDNNAYEDPFVPTDEDVVGVAAVHVPRVGLVATALTNPWIWVSLIVLALALLVWPGRREPSGPPEEASPEAPADTETPAVSPAATERVAAAEEVAGP